MKRVKATKANGYAGILAKGRLVHLVGAATVSEDPETDWDAYCNALGHSDPNPGEKRLFPVIAHRLGTSAKSVQRPDLLKSECQQAKYAFIREVLLCRQVQSQLGSLKFQPIFLKGLSLKSTVYPEPWMRRSSDLDLFIPRRKALEAISLLQSNGWFLPKNRQAVVGFDHQVDVQSGVTLERKDGFELDLHWIPRTVFQAFPEEVQKFQDDAISVDLDGAGILVPSPTWMLFETFDHGIRYNPVAPIRWMLDAWLLLDAHETRSDVSIDFDAFFEITEKLKATARIKTAFEAMQEANLPLPEPVKAWLAKAKPSRLEKLEHWSRFRPNPPIFWSLFHYGPDYLLRYPGQPIPKIMRLPYHIWVERCGYRSFGQVAKRAIRIFSVRT